LEAARQWALWELSTCTLEQSDDAVAKADDERFSLAFARIEAHFFINEIFLEDDYIINNIKAIRDIPGAIIHGRYDVICPAENAWRLHSAWPQSELTLVAKSGHSITEPGIAKALVAATNRFA
jgi:proline iminopeptidase